jgi:hypothetical protein
LDGAGRLPTGCAGKSRLQTGCTTGCAGPDHLQTTCTTGCEGSDHLQTTCTTRCAGPDHLQTTCTTACAVHLQVPAGLAFVVRPRRHAFAACTTRCAGDLQVTLRAARRCAARVRGLGAKEENLGRMGSCRPSSVGRSPDIAASRLQPGGAGRAAVFRRAGRGARFSRITSFSLSRMGRRTL